MISRLGKHAYGRVGQRERAVARRRAASKIARQSRRANRRAK